MLAVEGPNHMAIDVVRIGIAALAGLEVVGEVLALNGEKLFERDREASWVS